MNQSKVILLTTRKQIGKLNYFHMDTYSYILLPESKYYNKIFILNYSTIAEKIIFGKKYLDEKKFKKKGKN